MNTVCQKNKCTGCMACVDICPKKAITVEDSLSAYNAVIDGALCVNCNACHTVCQQNTAPKLREPAAWYQGWAANPLVREAGSSGGVAGALSLSFLRTGGCVCSCVYDHGAFTFRIADTPIQVAEFAGSKYIKSNPSGIYPQIKQRLMDGTPVLFIGLPCQCAAVRAFVGEKLQDALYTVDLICHGTPSPAVLGAFLSDYGMKRKDLRTPTFRDKGNFRLADGTHLFVPEGCRDRYTLAFLNGLTYTENCYDCPYAKTERVSDVTLGDSWGSQLSKEEIQKGISLVLCQTEKGRKLLNHANLHLTNVDKEIAIDNNRQLQEPSARPAPRQEFLRRLKGGISFHKAIYAAFPQQCLRQKIKGLLIRLNLKKH